MAQIIKSLSLDVSRKNRIRAILAKQYDNDSRFLRIQLNNEGEPIPVQSGYIVLINATRPNGESESFMGSVNDDGSVTVPITYWMLEQHGKVKCDISIISEQGIKLSSLGFSIEVEKANGDGDNISDNEDCGILVQLIADVKQLEDNFKAVFIRYSANADGEDYSDTWSDGMEYIGIANTADAPSDKSGYVWCKFAPMPKDYELTDEDKAEIADQALRAAKQNGAFDGAPGTDGKSAYAYAQEGGYTGTEAEFAANLAREVPETLSLGIASDGLIYLFVNGQPIGTGIPQGQSGDVFGYVDENNTIVLNGNLADGTYTLKYEMSNGDIVNIGNMVLDSTVYYTVTSNLTNCSISNSAKTVAQGESYSATITANDGYELKSVTVTMGGSAVSVSGGVINIASVTGDIVIAAVAEEIKAAYTNLADPSSSDWWADSYLGSDATRRTGKTGFAVSNFIGPVNVGDVICIKGVDLTGTTAEYRCAPYKSDKAVHGSYGAGSLSTLGGLSTKPITAVTITATGGQFTNNQSDIKYWRIGGKLNGSASDVIITINEPIV